MQAKQKNQIKDRFKGHFYNITHNDNLHPIGRHFNLPDHGIGKNLRSRLKIHILKWIKHPSNSAKAARERDFTELKYIFILNTSLPFGLNSVD